MDTLLRRCRLRCLVRPTPQSQRSMQDYSQLLQTQWQQRIVHTHTFKIFEYGAGFTRQSLWWKKLARWDTLVFGLWNISSMESLVM